LILEDVAIFFDQFLGALCQILIFVHTSSQPLGKHDLASTGSLFRQAAAGLHGVTEMSTGPTIRAKVACHPIQPRARQN
jgi:hypothetical protein